METPKRFKVGDIVHPKPKSDLLWGRYFYGGQEIKNETVNITEYIEFKGSVNCWKIRTDYNGYVMIESEMVEYHSKPATEPLQCNRLTNEQLVPGKWYYGSEWMKGSCGKISHFIPTSEIKMSEHFYKRYFNEKTTWSMCNYYTEVPYEDLVQFLPEGHPDLIKPEPGIPTSSTSLTAEPFSPKSIIDAQNEIKSLKAGLDDLTNLKAELK